MRKLEHPPLTMKTFLLAAQCLTLLISAGPGVLWPRADMLDVSQVSLQPP